MDQLQFGSPQNTLWYPNLEVADMDVGRTCISRTTLVNHTEAKRKTIINYKGHI